MARGARATKALALLAVALVVMHLATQEVFSALDQHQSSRMFKVPAPVAKSARQEGKGRLRAEWKVLASYAKEPSATHSLSMRHSRGFFDIPDRDWQLRAAIAVDQSKRNLEHSTSSSVAMDNAAAWWTENWHASWSCADEVRLGDVGDGGKWVCDPNRVKPVKCLVWSVGSAGDFGFEESIHEELGCEIHTFDMGDYAHLAPSFVNYHQWGLSAVAAVTASGTFKTLEGSLRELGQLERKIDIFKIDIEGAEFQVLTPMLQKAGNFLSKNVQQVLVEVHPKPLPELHTLMAAFLENGFYVYHKELNTFGCYGSCLEIALVRLDLPPTRASEPLASFRGASVEYGSAQLRQLIFERQMLLQSMQPGDGWFPMGVSKDTVIPKYKILLREYAQRGSAWYQYNWEPCVSCAAKRRVGGHWLCDPQALFALSHCMVYLVNDKAVPGVGALPAEFAHQVKGDYACDGQIQPDLVEFRALLEPGQSARSIDFMQVNIRGGEFVSLLPLVRKQAFRATVKQVCVRLHYAKTLLDNVMQDSKYTPDALNDELLAAFSTAGYAIFAKEYVATKECGYGECADYYFVRGDLVSLNLHVPTIPSVIPAPGSVAGADAVAKAKIRY